MTRFTAQQRHHTRRGSIAPLLVLCLLVLLLVAAWVIDRAWVSSAYGELVSATEASAHAAAVELLDDSRLTTDGDALRVRRATYRAVDTAAKNRVAGRALTLDADRDVRFASRGDETFVKDVFDPRVVAVTAGRSERRGNSLGLLLSSLGGVAETDIEYTAIVRLENRLAGVHADESHAAPVLPIGIMATSTDEVLGWDAIDRGRADDYYAFDRDDHTVTEAADGLPELTVTIDVTADANGAFVSAEGFTAETLKTLVTQGHTAGPIDFGTLSQTFATSASPVPAVIEELGRESMIGRPRVLFLTEQGRVTNVVAGRVMAVEQDALGRPQLIIQPCVMTLARAIVADGSETMIHAEGTPYSPVASAAAAAVLPESNVSAAGVEPNRYLFKLLTVR